MRKYIILLVLACSTSLFANESTQVAVEENKSMVAVVTDWYANNMNYWSITALMTVESSFIPFPSEVVIPPAVYVANETTSDLHVTDSYFLNVLLIVLFGTIGALLGAIINYFLAVLLGRPVIHAFADSKLGRLCLLSSAKIQKAEDYFNKHGKVATFIGRLIPGIRQLVSIPAGLARMNFGIFLLYTFLGAGIWNIVLAALGYFANGQKEMIDKYSHELSIIILAILGLAVVYWVVKTIIKKRKSAEH